MAYIGTIERENGNYHIMLGFCFPGWLVRLSQHECLSIHEDGFIN